MIARNVTKLDLEQALEIINLLYKGNVTFKTLGSTGPRKVAYNFTLTVKDSSAPGHRLGMTRNKDGNRRRLAAACWHVHGNFFDALLGLEPQATITTSWPNGQFVVDRLSGNWTDWRIGGMADPLLYSMACEC